MLIDLKYIAGDPSVMYYPDVTIPWLPTMEFFLHHSHNPLVSINGIFFIIQLNVILPNAVPVIVNPMFV